MLSTDKLTNSLTNQRYQKHNLLCQGGNQVCSSFTICITECRRLVIKANPNASGSLPAPRSEHATSIMVFFVITSLANL